MANVSDFERGMIVAARRLGRSTADTAELLGFPRTTVSKVYKEWCKEQKTSSECEQKPLDNEKGEEDDQLPSSE